MHGIRYVYMGDLLGGRPKDLSCYKEGKINYNTVKTKDFFKRGINRLKTAYSKDVSVALMCSERNPCQCHRTRLIGTVLDQDNILLKHIDEKGKLKDHITVVHEINKGLSDIDLFGGNL